MSRHRRRNCCRSLVIVIVVVGVVIAVKVVVVVVLPPSMSSSPRLSSLARRIACQSSHGGLIAACFFSFNWWWSSSSSWTSSSSSSSLLSKLLSMLLSSSLSPHSRRQFGDPRKTLFPYRDLWETRQKFRIFFELDSLSTNLTESLLELVFREILEQLPHFRIGVQLHLVEWVTSVFSTLKIRPFLSVPSNKHRRRHWSQGSN